jgi:hypothetical protein
MDRCRSFPCFDRPLSTGGSKGRRKPVDFRHKNCCLPAEKSNIKILREKGKALEKVRRKATGLSPRTPGYGSRVAEQIRGIF